MDNDAAIQIDPTAQIASDAKISAPRVSIGAHVQILPGAIIEASKEIRLQPEAIVGKNVRIRAADIRIGYATRIGDNGNIRGQKGLPSELVSIGDFVMLDYGANILARRLVIGDYVSIYKDVYVAGGRGACQIGHNCWIGQDTILDTNEELTIGNNVRIGTGSQLWTHVASGELLEGCTLFGRNPLVIEDNVWIVGGAVISPGLVLRNGSVIMVGSVLTKSTQARGCYAGVPARDVSDKLNIYKPVTMDDKWVMMEDFLCQFAAEAEAKDYQVEKIGTGYHLTKGGYDFAVVMEKSPDWDTLSLADRDTLVFTTENPRNIENPQVSIFSLLSKRYIKRRTSGERMVITFLNGYMARFVPEEM